VAAVRGTSTWADNVGATTAAERKTLSVRIFEKFGILLVLG
jgi:hypothetical protein